MGKIEKQTGKIENHTGKIRRGKKLKNQRGKIENDMGEIENFKGVKYPNINFFFGSKNTAFLYYTRKLEYEEEKYDGKYTYVMVN